MNGWERMIADQAAEIDRLRQDREAAIVGERERIATAIEAEADVCPCTEDATVLRGTAALVRANFSHEDAEAQQKDEDSADQ